VLVVTLNLALGIQSTLVLNTDYSVTLNANQDYNPGGTITLLQVALQVGYSLVLSSAIPELQGTELTNQGGFYPEVVTTEFDLLTILIQQMQERVNRTINFPITDPSGISTQVPPVAQRAGMYLSFDANGVPQTVISAPNQPSPQTLSFGYIETTSTAGQTVFATPPYTPGANNLFVVSGGLTLTNTVDYIETASGSITLTAPSPAGDIYTFRSIVATGFTPGSNTPYVVVVPYAASVTLNAGLADGFYLAGMTGNLTIAGVWGLAPGQPIAMYYQQDAVGGRTVTFPAIMAGAAQPDPLPYAVSLQCFGFDAVTGKLRASGPLVSANGAFFAEAITTLANVAAAAINATGPITGVSVSLSGELTAPTASVGSIAAASEVVSGLLTAGSITLAAPGTAGQVLTNVGGVFVPSTPFAPPATTMSIVTGARSFNTVYHNTSGYRLTVSASASISSGVANGVDCYGNVASTSAALPASGAGAQTVAANSVTNSTGQTGVTFVVPPGYYYNFTWDDIPGSSPVPTLTYWTEWVN